MGIKKVIFTVAFLLFFGLLFVNSASAEVKSNEVKQPLILSVGSIEQEYAQRPVIKGLTQAGTDVLVYIDGLNYGLAKVNIENTPTDNFYFQPSISLSLGEHVFEFFALDIKTGSKSKTATRKVLVKELPAPTVLNPNTSTVTSHPKTLIEGVTKSGTFVHVFIDGVYNGKTKTVHHNSGTAYFSYKPFLNLGVGKHTVKTVSETNDGLKSGYSQVKEFNIEHKLPAPIVIKVIDNKIAFNKPIIAGIAKNNLKVKVFIDKKLDGEFSVSNHTSGTANFAYHSKRNLYVGKHLVYATSIDSRGKESNWSNTVYFTVVDPNAPIISEKADKVVNDVAVEFELKDGKLSEKEENIEVLGIEKEAEKEEIEIKEESSLEEEEIVIDDKELEEILSIEEETEVVEGGLIDEDENNQSGIKMNLVIFILFLFAVVAWIFWVNRELIKERKEEDDGENNQEKMDFKADEKSKKKQ